jgi:hypothetical protein
MLMLAGIGSAQAAMPLGESFLPASISNCGGITWLQTGSPANQYAAQSNGVITSWTFFPEVTSPPQVKFKVARPTGGGNYSMIAESPMESPPGGVATTYTDIRVPVVAGDVIGLYVGGPVERDCGRGASGDYTYAGENGDVSAGVSGPLDDYVGGGFQFDIAATLEPDADNDDYGDETQDQCPADATTHQAPCPSPTTPPGPATTQANQDPKCERLRKKLRRWQRRKLAKAGTESKQAFITANIEDTKRRLAKVGCR